jgi:hypothetical protein
MKRLLLVPYTFVLLNWAAVKALYLYLEGEAVEGLWGDSRSPSPGRPVGDAALHAGKP